MSFHSEKGASTPAWLRRSRRHSSRAEDKANEPTPTLQRLKSRHHRRRQNCPLTACRNACREESHRAFRREFSPESFSSGGGRRGCRRRKNLFPRCSRSFLLRFADSLADAQGLASRKDAGRS